VEIADLPIIKHEAIGGVVEGVLVVEDVLLQMVDMILEGLLGDGSVSLAIHDGLKESICNGLEEGGINVRLGL
jgi:hypothetical protein